MRHWFQKPTTNEPFSLTQKRPKPTQRGFHSTVERRSHYYVRRQHHGGSGDPNCDGRIQRARLDRGYAQDAAARGHRDRSGDFQATFGSHRSRLHNISTCQVKMLENFGGNSQGSQQPACSRSLKTMFLHLLTPVHRT